MNCPDTLNQRLCINAVHWGGEEFLSGSDKNTYHAKEQGRNAIVA